MTANQLTDLESKLQKQQYLSGATPRAEDRDTLAKLKEFTIDPVLYPALFDWKAVVSRFSGAVQESWN